MRRQGSLYDLDQAGLPFEDPPVLVPPVEEEGPQQLLLFESRVLLLGELEQALAEADYGRAIEARESLTQEYGTGAVPLGVSYLDDVGADFWARPLDVDERLSGWEIIEAEHERGSFRWKTARRGFFRRLLGLRTVDDLGRATPEGLLPHRVNTL